MIPPIYAGFRLRPRHWLQLGYKFWRHRTALVENELPNRPSLADDDIEVTLDGLPFSPRTMRLAMACTLRHLFFGIVRF